MGGAAPEAGAASSADILDKYGIGSSTDVSELKDHDFIELEALGLKPFQLNKVKRWCETAVVTEVLSSSSTVAPPALTTCVTLSVGDGVPNEEDDTEGYVRGHGYQVIWVKLH
jgi:hypothetical protein